ncbi:MAG: PmoA family protein [Planctomycetota bacterium]
MPKVAMLLTVVFVSAFIATNANADGWAIEKVGSEKDLVVRLDDEVVAGFRADVRGAPVLYPVHAEGELSMTRGYPMKAATADEKDDHPHHRSLWLSHGEVNGIDYWSIVDGTGTIRMYDQSTDVTEDHATVTTENEWVDPSGQVIMRDIRRYTFRDDGRRIIDCDHRLMATEGEVRFGDTKEGTFAMRVPGTLKVDASKGGLITNEQGLNNKAAWGKSSPWVDYSGSVSGDTGNEESVGITIHNHPSSYGFPTRWHVRTYGLFAANPFGRHHFMGGERRPPITLNAGESLDLNYRVVIYRGEFDKTVAEGDAKAYHLTKRPGLELTAKATR